MSAWWMLQQILMLLFLVPSLLLLYPSLLQRYKVLFLKFCIYLNHRHLMIVNWNVQVNIFKVKWRKMLFKMFPPPHFKRLDKNYDGLKCATHSLTGNSTFSKYSQKDRPNFHEMCQFTSFTQTWLLDYLVVFPSLVSMYSHHKLQFLIILTFISQLLYKNLPNL